MESQVTQLKLNVTNIKSYLINSNKQLKALKLQKNNLFTKLEKQKEVREKEQRIEKNNLGIGSGFASLANTVTSPVRSIFDKILDFVGLIALGVLVQKLPQIIEQIDSFFNSDFIKSVGGVLTTLGNGFSAIGTALGIIPKQKQDEIDRELKSIENLIDKDLQESSQLEGDTSKLGSKPNQPKQPTPGSVAAPVEKSTPVQPVKIKPDNSPIKPPQTFSQGGTVVSEKTSVKNKLGSTKLKQSKRAMGEGFTEFSSVVDSVAKQSEKDEKNMLALASMSDSFREYVNLPSDRKRPGYKGKGAKAAEEAAARRKQTQYPDRSFASGAYIGPTGDTDGQHTGLNMNLAGGIGTPIYAPFDLIYKSRGTDGKASVGLQGTADALGPSGNGFGYYGAYYFQKDGKEYEVLMGHFKSLPYKGKKDGEVIPKGSLLGYQGASGRSVSADNGVYPHISLHVNGVGFRASNSVLVDVADKILTATPSTTSAGPTKKHQGPVIAAKPKGGGNRRLNSTSKGGSGRTVVIYAVQPVETYVPFPVPYETSAPRKSSPSTPTLPSIWRA